MSVDALGVLHKSEELKQFVLVFVLYSDSCVYHRDFQKFLQSIVFLNSLNDFNCCLDFSFLSEFQCISVETKEHLFDSILVGHDYRAPFSSQNSLRVNSYVLKRHRVLEALFLSFPFLNLHDVVDCIPYVKGLYIFSELAPFDLRVV